MAPACLAFAACLFALVQPSPSLAAWDQPTQFMQLIARHAPSLKHGAQLDLGSVAPHSGLALVAAQVQHPTALRALVQDGLRLLILVEPDTAPELLSAFGLRVIEAPTAPRLGGHPALIEIPATPRGLLAGLTPVVTNHPAGLAPLDDLEPAARFADGTAFAFSLRLGEGEVIVLADASVLIDLMLPVGGNRGLADRLARWLADEQRPVHVVTERLDGRRAPAKRAPAEHPINTFLTNLRRRAPDQLGITAIAAALTLLALAFALFGFPGRGRRRPSPAPQRDDTIAGRAAQPGGPADPHSPPGDSI
jgi:hypothetical protein